MTTEDIIKNLRQLSELPAYACVSETMTLAANAIEGLGLRFDDSRAESERLNAELAQAISERTPHDYGILRDQRDDYRYMLGLAAKEVLRLEDHIEDLKKAAITNLTAAVALVRPEPSRLEIAAMIFAGGTEQTITDAFLAAEELIEHARKTE